MILMTPFEMRADPHLPPDHALLSQVGSQRRWLDSTTAARLQQSPSVQPYQVPRQTPYYVIILWSSSGSEILQRR